MDGIPGSSNRSTAASATSRGSGSLLAIRVTSWLLMKVSGVKVAQKSRWRPNVQSSENRLRFSSESQMACHSSYWVTESTPEAVTNSA